MNTLILFVTLFLFMAMGMPISISLGLSSLLTILLFGQDSLASLAIKLYETSEHYTLLSIPFFILAGAMMSTGGVAKRMIRFAIACVSRAIAFTSRDYQRASAGSVMANAPRWARRSTI